MLVELKSVRREPVLVEYIFSSNEPSICASVQICARASIVPVASNVLERVSYEYLGGRGMEHMIHWAGLKQFHD